MNTFEVFLSHFFPSFENCLFMSQVIFFFFEWVICFFDTFLLSSLYMLDINPLPFVSLVEILSHFFGLFFFFTQLAVSLVVAKRFSFVKSHLSAVGLNSWSNEFLLRNSFPTCLLWRGLPMFSSRSLGFPTSGLGLCSIWSQFLFKVIVTHLFSFCCLRTSSFPSSIC